MPSFLTPLRVALAVISVSAGLLVWHLWGELNEANKTIGAKQEEIRTLEGDLLAAAESVRKQRETLDDLREVSKTRAADNAELENKVGDLQGRLSTLARDADDAEAQPDTETTTDETVCNFYRNDVPGGFIDIMRDATRAANGDDQGGSTDTTEP